METTLTLWEETETRHGDAGCRQLVERYYVERRFVERCLKCEITSTRQVVERRYVDSSTHLTPPPLHFSPPDVSAGRQQRLLLKAGTGASTAWLEPKHT